MNVKWIKLDVDIFNNRKIKQIKKMPEGRAIVNVWFQILCLAGKINDGGLVYFTKDIPYTEEMLAVEFDEEIKIIRLALQVFQQFKMIEIVDNLLLVSNWEKYQSEDKLKQIREQTRLRVAKHREKQKLLTQNECNVTETLHVTLRNAIDKDIDKDIEEDKNRLDKSNIIDTNVSMSVETDLQLAKSNVNYQKVMDYWNKNSKLKEITAITERRKGHINARIKEHGIDAIYKAIDNVANSAFLRGQNSRNWIATFDWVFKPDNFVKVLEGNYNQEKQKNPYDFYNIGNKKYPSGGVVYPDEK